MANRFERELEELNVVVGQRQVEVFPVLISNSVLKQDSALFEDSARVEVELYDLCLSCQVESLSDHF